MRNHIAFKFIAVLLCAVSLMGAVGSGIGIYIMTELDLFDKTVDQVREEQQKRNSEYYAEEVALRYASQTLGSCPEEMVNNHYGQWFEDFYESGTYSYSILDAEGNELYRFGDISEVSATYTYPVTGQYLHMVSMETESEQYARQQAKAASYAANFTIGGDAYVMDALPPEGQHVAYASICDVDGIVRYAAYNENGVGFLHYNQEGQVVFAGVQYVDDPELQSFDIGGVYFQALDGSVVYEATSVYGVGAISFNSAGQLVFTAGDLENAVSIEPQAEETQVSPAELVPVYYAAFYNETDDKIYRVRGSRAVGFLSLNEDGCLVFRGFQVEEQRLSEDVILTGTYFCDAEDNIVFERYGNDNIGTVSYTDNGQLIFTTAQPAPEFDPVELNLPAEEEIEETNAAEETEFAEETEPAEETKEASAASDIPESAGMTTAETMETETAPAEATAAAEMVTEPPVTEAVPETMATEAAAYMETAAAEPTPTETGLINGKPLEEYQVEKTTCYDDSVGETVFVSYVRVPMPEYTVELRLAPGALGGEAEYQLLLMLSSVGNYLFPALGICLLVFAIFAVYLCVAAGHKRRSEEVHAGGLNCLPLDLYTVIAVLGVALAANIGVEIMMYRLEENLLFSCTVAVAMAFAASLILIGYCFAIVAQVKTPGGYWWRNTLCIRFVMLFMHFGVWLEKFLSRVLFPVAGRMFKWLWNLTVKTVLGTFRLWQRFADWFLQTTSRIFRWLHARLHRFFSLLPLTWQWLVTGLGMLLLMALVFATNGEEILVVLCLGISIAIIVYGAHCFGLLSESTRRMSEGDLSTKVDDKLLLGCFKDFAGDLNDLADVAVVAAQKQLKSERMKTELITNVSHDIKTPLTSIINYVDLLQKPHSPEEQEQYLEVLSRQSLRLKKLIEDLMEMSKASTGNMTVEITTVDAVESVNQALGEFSDKLAAARLTPMFRHTESRVAMRADGKLVWRVLSNVLSNAVKYAMPGTRLYIDLMELEGKVVISLKNISREELNMDAEELMERFVRGDDSRNTEGSGLGLNIAKSLMELQRGQLQLLVDGDLFKVTLIFPGV